MTIQLSVSKVDFRGNTGDKLQYYYAFSRDTCVISKKIESLKIEFSESTHENFKMLGLYSTGDSYKIIGKTTLNNKNRELLINQLNKSQKGLLVTSILCSYTYEKDGNKYIDYLSCDPQVLNDPDIIT